MLSEKVCLSAEKSEVKRMVVQLNPEAFQQIREEIKSRGLTIQAALLLGLIKLLDLDMTLEQASPETNNK